MTAFPVAPQERSIKCRHLIRRTRAKMTHKVKQYIKKSSKTWKYSTFKESVVWGIWENLVLPIVQKSGLKKTFTNDDLVRLCRRFQNKPTNEIFWNLISIYCFQHTLPLKYKFITTSRQECQRISLEKPQLCKGCRFVGVAPRKRSVIWREYQI